MTTSRALGLLVLALAAPSRGQDVPAFVEVAAARATWFVRQPIPVTIRFGVERGFLADNLIQPFQAALDVPVRIEGGRPDAPAGVAVVAPVARPGPRATFVLDGRREAALRIGDRELDGRRFAVFELERAVLADRPGELVIAGATMRLEFATRFRESFLDGRVPEDRTEAAVHGGPLSLRIEPLPVVGRPPGFSGAVGRFSVRAEASPRELEVGENVRLVLRIEGEGNFASFDAPRLDRLDGFHLFGSIEDRGPDARTITCDLAPLRPDVTAVPAIEFAFFDPEPPGRYRSVRTEPLPIVVRADPAAAPVAPADPDVPAPVAGVDDIFDLKDAASAGPPRRRLAPGLGFAVLLAPWLVAGGLLLWRRTRDRAPRDPRDATVREALGAIDGGVAPDALAGAFTAYLAARLGCAQPAVVAPDLGARLEVAGVPRDLAARASGWLEILLASRHGGGAPADAAGETRALTAALEVVFGAAEGSR